MRVLALTAATLVALATLVAPAHAAATPIYRSQIIERAKIWLTANNGTRVPYDQDRKWTDGYRMDCSGYASMAAKLPKDPDAPNTQALIRDDLTFAISMAELKRGDLIIDAIGDGNNRHVVIFDRWVDSSRNGYYAYEQRGGYGTDYRTRGYGLEPYSEYRPRRLHNVIDK
jgi:hypothetical protein